MRTASRFVVVAVLAAAVVVVPSRVEARPDHPHHAHFMQCAKVCADCQLTCDMCFVHCKALLAEGKKEHEVTAQVCADCAECCKLAATLSARMSPLAVEACDCCAKCCDKCAAECDKHQADPRMKECAQKCRECAKVCREMIQHLSAPPKK
ncbi:MAG TPA: four-helix bundle copper-binding protein [Gemmataceae bacterium]|nr:four-helix bundle copper-binding protein [Gemmataceae bacterium]